MKTFTKFLTMLAVAALFATGCVNEEPPYKEDPNPEPAGMTGYLSIGNLSMTVVYDETEIRPDDTSDETQAARTASGTRATAPDVDSFIVEILDADNAQVLEMTYAELKEQLKTPMELKVGVYRMEVRSEDTMPGADWEHPVYGATSDFTITKAWPGHDMTQPFTLTDAMFDAEGNCIEPFAFDLSSPNGIESLQVTVGSTNSQFLASMSAIQLPQTFDLCALDASSAAGIILKGFGYPVGSELKGQTAKSFNIAGQIRALYEFDGTHTFAFTMTDAKGVSSEAVLTLVVDKSSGQTGPRITWRGYDIDQQYEVQKDMVIDIDIEADKGIKSFFVTIDSETLRPLLPVINLPEKFDICDIPDELVEVLHGEFGFPINEQVKNRTSVTFSITKFVEILLEIPGEHNFVLDVTDNDNVLTHKTVKLIVH